LRHLLEIKAPLGGAADHGYSEALYLRCTWCFSWEFI
jgi:catechol-2,3-dioxygenase